MRLTFEDEFCSREKRIENQSNDDEERNEKRDDDDEEEKKKKKRRKKNWPLTVFERRRAG
jgi:hypothetical protein